VTALKVVGTVLLALVAALGIDGAVLSQRIQREPIKPSLAVSSAHSETWVVVGADDKPVTVDGELYLDSEGNPLGSRADVVVVIQVPDDGGPARVLSVPRDLTVRYDRAGHEERLGVTLTKGTDRFLGALCEGLGIPADHLALVTMQSMIDLVDAVGGIELDIDYPIRDASGIVDIPEAGLQTLDGFNALGLVRARLGERYIDGEWVPLSEAEGNAARAKWAGLVVDAFMSRVRQVMTNPAKLQKLALAGTAGVTLDQHTTVLDLARLAPRVGDDMEQLPVEVVPFEEMNWTSFPNDDTYAMLETYDYYPGGCVQEGL
jgi:LCP family protein required for cell wall assembly